MKSAPDTTRSFEFCFIDLDYTLVRVEETEGRVTIRATANTFSRQRKNCFIRELAAEGFIPDDRWYSLSDTESYCPGIRWLVDRSWVKLDTTLNARNQRLARKYLFPITFLWLLVIYLAFPGPGKTGPSGAGAPVPRSAALASR